MRLFLITAAVGVPILGALASQLSSMSTVTTVDVRQYDVESAFTRLDISDGPDGKLTSPLIFEVEANPVQDILSSGLVVNGQHVDINYVPYEDGRSPALVAVHEATSQTLSIPDTSGFVRAVNISFGAVVFSGPVPADDATQSVTFEISSVDDVDTPNFGFVLIISPLSSARLQKLIPWTLPDIVEFSSIPGAPMTMPLPSDGSEDSREDGSEDNRESDSFDIDAEIESLLLLEVEAQKVQSKLAAKKHAIGAYLKNHRNDVSLRQLLKQCDGIVCAAKAITQNICDKIGISTEPSFSLSASYNPQKQAYIALADECNEKVPQNSRNCTKSAKGAASHPDGNPVESSFASGQLKLSESSNTLIRIFAIIAGALGLSTLFSILRRKCMSIRTRVEREADREERRNARAYRRAARRAYMRARWDAFIGAINCFKQRQSSDSHVMSFEEKQALILQDALLEQDLDLAEKGQIMEAEIRELRHAHEIVSGLVRVSERRYLVGPIHDDLAPRARIPRSFTPGPRSSVPSMRSRAASSGTLPSYSSDTPPDYTTSAPLSRCSRASSIVDGTTLLSPSDDGRRVMLLAPSETGHSAAPSQYTPDSSVLGTASRPSQETLRTRQSRDTRDFTDA